MADTKSAAADPIGTNDIVSKMTGFWTSTSDWISANSADIAIAVLVGIGLYLGLSLARRIGMRLKGRADPLGVTPIIGRVFERTGQFFMVMVPAKLVAGHASPPAVIAEIIHFLFIIAAVFQGAVWLRELVMGVLERRAGDGSSGETLANAMGIIRLIVTVAIFAVAAVVVLDNMGVNVTGLVAGLGIGGIAIGLAAQGIFSDLFAALSIIFDRPFVKGETITYDQTTATVERIGLKSTRLRALTGEKKIISNTNLLGKEITSYVELDHRRMSLALAVVYHTDPEVADRIPAMLKAIVEEQGGVFVRSGFIGFGQSSLDFELLFDVFSADYETIYHTRHRIGLAILRRFRQEGIEFAYPTQTTFTAAPDGTLVMPYAERQD